MSEGGAVDARNETEEIDVKKIIEGIRKNIGGGQQRAPSTGDGPRFDSQVALDVASLHRSYDVYHINFTSHRKVVGWLLVAAKKVLRKLLTPILERQVNYNAANARAVSHLWQQGEEMRRQFEEVRPVASTVWQQVGGVRQQQQALRAELVEQVQGLGRHLASALMERDARLTALERDERIAELERTILRLKASLIVQESRISILLEEVRKRLAEPLKREQSQMIADEGEHLLDELFAVLADQLFGTREDRKEHLRGYVPIIKEARIGTEERPVLDVGCGRGEWLELLKGEEVRAEGVDLNRVLVEDCRRRGLEVVESDAVGYLRSLPDSSFGAVTGFHIIEHMPFEAVIKLLDETVRVLRPGGLAIFETLNPENVLVGSRAFYTDPTRRTLLLSSTLKFIAEARGLCRVEIRYLHPHPDAYRVREMGLDVARRFNEYFCGPQDYAVVGWRA